MMLRCETLVVHCIDYRLQGFLEGWLKNNLPAQSYDRAAIAGGIHDVFYVMRQVDLAYKLHQIKRVVLINHEDCGAYGSEGNFERHKADLEAAGHKIKSIYPELNVETYYLHLSGEFESTTKSDR